VTIFQLISSQGYFGAESMLLALARTLPELGCRSLVGVFQHAGDSHLALANRARDLGIQAETVPCTGRWDSQAVARIRRIVESESVDVLHTHGYKADLYGYAAAWPGRAALVATCHNWPSPLWSMRAYAALDRLVLRRFDRVATASGPVAETLKRWKVPAHKLYTVPNGVDMEPFRDAAPTLRSQFGATDDLLIGFAGRFVPEKGGAVLLSAAPAVLAAFPNAKFVFAGEGPARAQWEAQAAQLGIASRVLFAGNRKDMPAVYASLDMLVLPSFAEAMPMCLLEALSAARPVIATPVGAVPKVILPGVTGLLCEPGDAAALSSAIVRLLRDPRLARELGHHGRAHVTRQFAAGVVARRYTALYQEALRDRTLRAGVPSEWQRSRP